MASLWAPNLPIWLFSWFLNMVHKQEGADKLHYSDMCGMQWDMSPDGHCGATHGTFSL